ncbi:MAG: hypothetical protein ACOYBE_00335 [Blautia sp.]|jgi:predicted phage-related endonuclease
MGERAIANRLRKLKELEEQRDTIQREIESLKDEIKKDMERREVDELQAGDFLVKWKAVIGSRFDSKAFKKEHESLYSQYLRTTECKRFTVA